MMLSKSFIALSLALLSIASPVADTMVIHNSRQAAPVGFKASGPAPSEQTIDIRIALASNNIAGLEAALYDVSTPSSANYRKFLSKEQVESFVKPSDETVSKVNAWLKANDLTGTPVSEAGEWIKITVPISKANELFAADYQFFTHTNSGKQAFRTLSYSLPASLKGDIQGIHPATSFDFGQLKAPKFQVHQKEKRALPSSCSSEMTPSCLQQLYGIPTAAAKQSNNALAVSGFIEQFAQTADLSNFLRLFRTDLPRTNTFKVVSVDGGQNTQSIAQAGIEADLDTQYTVGIASGVPVTFYTVGESNSDGIDGFIDIVTSMEAQSTVPHVWTTSYGFNEQDLDASITSTVCNSYMAFGARGASIFMSSGDGGVGGSQPTGCTRFLATFPSSCPFVTSVGATTGFSPETAADFSSGGFSEFFTQPSYQSSAVSSFLTRLGSTNSGKFNAQGRAFPDISAQGTNIPIVFGGQTGLVAGTSCSTPIMASITALLNDQLLSQGKAPLGFLNPLLYSTGASAFTDITAGDNPGCSTNGFNATTGWDPVTGLGTPVFSKLQSVVGL